MAGTTPTAQAQSNYQPSYSADTYNPAQATGELQQAAGYQDQQQNANLMSMLAAQGISPGSSAAQAADQNLSYGQSAALDPSLAGVQQYAGGLGVQNNQFNSGAFNTAELTQAGAQNQDWVARWRTSRPASADEPEHLEPDLARRRGGWSSRSPFSGGVGGGGYNPGVGYGVNTSGDGSEYGVPDYSQSGTYTP